MRRAKLGFREGASETDPAKQSSLVASAQDHLQTVKRQSLVYGIYARKIKNILVGAEGQRRGGGDAARRHACIPATMPGLAFVLESLWGLHPFNMG